MPPCPKPPKHEKKIQKPIRRSWIKTKPVHERRSFTQSERTILEAELDRLCSIYIRRRDGKCVTCHSRKNLTCSHFYKRAYQEVRYEVHTNLNTQCETCNQNHNTDRSAYTAYMVKKYGVETIRILHSATRSTTFKWSIPELREKLAEIQDLLG